MDNLGATAGPTSGSATTSPGSTRGGAPTLDAAFNQLRQYALALENPPLLIVSDTWPAVPGPAGFGERVSRRHKLR